MDAKIKLLRVDQVAERLAISRTGVYQLIQAGKLRSLRVCEKKGYRIEEAELEKFVVEAAYDPDK